MSQNKISAKIVADSINKQGNRITTMEVVFPRFILAEFNTHRLFTRNSASSRAIPFKKMLKSVQESPFVPIAWQKDHSGMQGTEYFEDDLNLKALEAHWLASRDHAVDCAESFSVYGLTKQLANRLLEPYMYHKVLVTFTESENFFSLRCPQYENIISFEKETNKVEKKIFRSRKDFKNFAQCKFEEYTDLDWLKINRGMGEIHIMDLAEKMWDAMNESTPTLLKAGQWHIPYGDQIEFEDVFPFDHEQNRENNEKRLKIAVARCARLSYQTLGENPVIDYKADLKLFQTLLESRHLSPFEHVARCMDDLEYETFVKGLASEYGYDEGGKVMEFSEDSKGWCNNFRGFIQYRWLLENEKTNSK